MINYYVELKISPDAHIDKIKAELLKQERVWISRETTQPERAREKLSLIDKAKKIFASSSSKAAYDRELEENQREPLEINPETKRQQIWRRWYCQALSYAETRQWDLAKTAMEKALSYVDECPTARAEPISDHSAVSSFACGARMLAPVVSFDPLTGTDNLACLNGVQNGLIHSLNPLRMISTAQLRP